MDFNAFDSVSAAEKSAKMHVKHPATGQPLYDNPEDPTKDNGKPCLVLVKGSEAPSVRDQVRKEQKKRAADKDDEITTDDLNESICKAAARLIVGFENVHKGKALAKAPQDIDWFLGLNQFIGRDGEESFAQQVTAFATSRANYLGNVSNG